MARRVLQAVVLVAASLGLSAPFASAESLIEVTSTGDVAPPSPPIAGSLRDALSEAQDGDTIHVRGGYYSLAAPLAISKQITIRGDGPLATILHESATGQRVIDVLGGAGVTISGVTVENGSALEGGGINAASGVPVTLADDAIVGNSAVLDGGGILATGSLTMDRVLVSGNHVSSGDGGGIEVFTSASPSAITNSTIANNGASGAGGGIALSTATLVLVRDTLAGNSATTRGGNLALFNNGHLQAGSTVFTGGEAAQGVNCDLSATGASFIDLGHNADALTNSCGLLAGNNDILVDDPQLGPLQDNGGPTQTMLPAAGSPLLEHGGEPCDGVDQRGVARPQGNACDIGAVERAGVPNAGTPTITGVTATSATVSAAADTAFLDGSGAFGYRTDTGAELRTAFQPLLGGLATQQIGAQLTELTPGTVYHVHLIVHTAIADATSTDTTFTTLPAGGGGGGGAGAGGGPGPVSAPRMSSARLTHARFRVSRRATAIAASTHAAPLGTHIRFTLSAAAAVKLAITHGVSGRRSGRRCVAPTAALRRAHAKRCTRTLHDGTLTRSHLRAGSADVAFSGRIGRRALTPRRYTLTLTATNAAGSSRPVRLRFTIVR
jgi:hypothetical protein